MCGRDFLASRIQFTAWLSNPEKISKILREERFSEKFLRSARPPDSVFRTLVRVIVNVTSARTSRKPSSCTGSSPALGAIRAFRVRVATLSLPADDQKKLREKSAPNVPRQAPSCIYQSGRDNLFNVRIQMRRTALRLLRPPSRSDCFDGRHHISCGWYTQ